MFPCSDHRPSGGPEQGRGFRVPLPVPLHFRRPELGIGSSARVMLRAPVPEASVDEDGDSGGSEQDVRATVQSGDGAGVDSITEAVGVKEFANRQLWFGVTATVAPHRTPDRRAGSPGISAGYRVDLDHQDLKQTRL